eukprot:gene56220-47283_t
MGTDEEGARRRPAAARERGDRRARDRDRRGDEDRRGRGRDRDGDQRDGGGDGDELEELFRRARIPHLLASARKEEFDEETLREAEDDELRELGWPLAGIIKLRKALGQ